MVEGNCKTMSAIKPRHFILVVSGILMLSSLISLAGILAILPRAMDEFLLTNEDYCYSSISPDHSSWSGEFFEDDRSRRGEINSHWNSDQCSIDDAMLHHDKSDDNNAYVLTQQQQQRRSTKLQQLTNSILWKIALNIWKQPINECDNAPLVEYRTNLHGHSKGDAPFPRNDNYNNQRTRYMHPMCDSYRRLQSRIQFEQLAYPWTWYFRTCIHMRYLTLRSLKSNVELVTRRNNNQGMIGWSTLPEREVVSPTHTTYYTKQSDSSSYSQSRLPPSMEIETLDISFRSAWVRPIISAQVHGIVVNLVIQSSEFSLPLQRSNHDNGKSSNNTAFLFGDMTLHEVLEILPKPPEVEGLYPRIGLVNITNVTLCVYENKENNSAESSSLKVLMKIRVPDKIFLPITNMTLGTYKHE